MKRIIFLLTALVVLTTSTAYAAKLGIREIELGMGKQQAMELLNKHPGIKCISNSCREEAEIIRPAKFFYMFGSENGKLNSIGIEFDDSHFDAMLQGMIDKYGKETEIQHGIWQSKGGVKLNNSVYVWILIDGQMKASKIGNKMGVSSIIMLGNDYLEEMRLRKMKDKQLPGF
jgi:hypothetical protein